MILSPNQVVQFWKKPSVYEKTLIVVFSPVSYKSYFIGEYQVLLATEEGEAKKQQRRKFHCKFCGEMYEHLANLKLHQIIHQKEEYPYSCKRCKKSFSRLSGISLHDCKKDMPEIPK